MKNIEQEVITLGRSDPLLESEQFALLSKIISRLLLSAFRRGDWDTAYQLSLLDIEGMIRQRSRHAFYPKLPMCLLRDPALSESVPAQEL